MRKHTMKSHAELLIAESSKYKHRHNRQRWTIGRLVCMELQAQRDWLQI